MYRRKIKPWLNSNKPWWTIFVLDVAMFSICLILGQIGLALASAGGACYCYYRAQSDNL